MKRTTILALAVLGSTIFPTLSWGGSKCDRPHEEPCDVTLGRPRVWGYERLYPLLDGLFQDVSATQLAQLTLNPNTANASSLDAVQNAFQAGVSFSQTAGATNALAQQLNSVLATNASVQNELLSRQGQLVQSALTAQQQVGSAQALVDQLNQSPNATDTQKAAAKQGLTAATDNVTSINNQLSLVKSQVASNLGSPQTFQPPSTTTQASPPTLNSALLGLVAPPGNSTPSFPSSKQMDNQINLLWERLARLTGTLAQPDSLKGFVIDLVEINVGAMPLDRKKKLLGVEYSIRCSADPAAHDAGKPKLVPRGTPVGPDDPLVLDLFPSASTVNIVDTKYRENRIGLAAALSWFTVGINAAYNRDHLRMSQSLGQSGYITGYGVGDDEFGWVFGRNLGDDTLTPGERTVFALVAVPTTCKKLTVRATKAGWFEAPSNDWHSRDERTRLNLAYEFCPASGESPVNGSCDPQPAAPKNQIREISYAPAEFDPAAPTKPLVSLEIKTSQPIDSQQVISINGKIIKRSRDSFGRGVSSGGSGGLLETANIDPNSWLPTGSLRFTLTLDPSAFGRSFPDIEIVSPSGSITVKEWLKPKGATVNIAGRDFVCSNTCIADLPALGYPKGAVKQLLLSQLRSPDKTTKTLLVTVLGDQAANTQGGADANGVPTLQVLSESNQAVWGEGSVVLATFNNQTTYRLECQPQGSRLFCKPPVGLTFEQPFNIQVIDPDHNGGGVTGSLIYNCGSEKNCYRPLVWRLDPPQWQGLDNHQELKLHMELANVNEGQVVALFGNASVLARAACSSGMNSTCAVDLLVPESQFLNVTDQMTLQFVDSKSSYPPTASLRFLFANSRPLVTGLNTDQTFMTGQNLRFATLRVGADGKPIPMRCDSAGSQCFILTTKDDKGKTKDPFEGAQGFLFFTDDLVKLEALQVKAGVVTQISRTGPAQGAGPNAPAGPQPGPPININIQNLLQGLGKLQVQQ
jgi:hypothetical protein